MRVLHRAQGAWWRVLRSRCRLWGAARPLTIIKQLGFGLAVAVLLDAAVIRSILLAASMRLLGAWNWWLPHVTIESEVDEDETRWD